MNFSKLTLILSPFILLLIVGCYPNPRFGNDNEGGRKQTTPSPRTSTSKNHAASEVQSNTVLLRLEGVASYYAGDFHTKVTSSGEQYNMYSLTAAHRTFPFGTKVRVVNLENNKSVVVRINDRGPFHESRIIDLSYGAAKELDMLQTGTARVRLEVLEWGKGQ